MATSKEGTPKPTFILKVPINTIVLRIPMAHRLSSDFKGMVFPSLDFDFLVRSK